MAEWKSIIGYENEYLVSNNGDVFSFMSKKYLKPSINEKGYMRVCLQKRVMKSWKRVNRLVAEAFIPNPDNLPMVNHKDEDKTNNFLENLEWCTAQYNNTYGNKAKRQANKIRGIAHSNEHKKKITSSLLKYYETHDSASIGRISEKRKGVVGVRNGESVQFQSVKDAAIAVNGARANITRSCNSKTRKAYGYKWMWAGERKEGQA